MNTSKQESSSSSQSSPWGPQATALTSAFDNANTAYGKASTAVAPSNFTAGMTPQQLQNFQQMLGYSNGNSGLPNAVTSNGATAVNAGTNAATGALNSMGGFNPSATNNIGSATAGASAFANGLDIPAAVRNAMLGATQTARDVTLPGMESGAAGNGNINSSRTGLAEGLVRRGLAEQSNDLASTMYNNAWTHGADVATNQNETNNAQTIQNNSAAGAIGNNTSATGASQVGAGITDAGNLFNLAGQGGAGLQQGNQLDLTNKLQQYEAGVSSPYDALNGLMSIIGSRNWGSNSTGTQTQTNTPSPLQTAGGIMSAFSFL